MQSRKKMARITAQTNERFFMNATRPGVCGYFFRQESAGLPARAVQQIAAFLGKNLMNSSNFAWNDTGARTA